MKSIAKVLNRLTELPMLVAGATLFILMVLTFADVIMRSTFSAPIEAATELTRIAMAVIVFSALPVVSGRAEHIVVDLLDPLFQRARIKRILDGVITLACGILLVWPAMRAFDLAERARSYGDLTEYLSIPVFYITWFIALMTLATAGAMALRGVVTLFMPELLRGAHD
ncbi:TRAP-type C4-dicarboxylate transport system, small permease component [Hoeflea phototrophica DFL-43]|jgi:TRAP-type C4-dicarboxylate transport system permease small subunit|uniref:TRAP transporter small permease protein n=1 Tax=Hoeflea phototrophica (strain DSM 17068 / NCIMB 14078 / DFL-43) TaxID=411684 RepID=A9DD44_HOEPD|nr:TRAP transporter small permease subunit [Hoeflea phototrophica]EDQ32269.1 TRAP-type C4-dicarboxylate transport system, small permease component [Hoeflea phototrophica DFL-43]